MANERARFLRSNQTDAEKKLWRALRGKQLDGHRFRRQHPLGPFILDFVCLERKLVVELDGGQHGEDRHAARDVARDRFLLSRGYDVLRFWNTELYESLDSVVERIREALQSPPGSCSHAAAAPPPP